MKKRMLTLPLLSLAICGIFCREYFPDKSEALPLTTFIVSFVWYKAMLANGMLSLCSSVICPFKIRSWQKHILKQNNAISVIVVFILFLFITRVLYLLLTRFLSFILSDTFKLLILFLQI